MVNRQDIVAGDLSIYDLVARKPSKGVRVQIRLLSRSQHASFSESHSASFLQCPSWGDVKTDWQAESVGWERNGRLVGAALILYRRPPGFSRPLAYVPEGPTVCWDNDKAAAWLEPLIDHVRSHDPFAIRIGPEIVARWFRAETVKRAIGHLDRLIEVNADASDLRASSLVDELRATGWRSEPFAGGFGKIQPRQRVQIRLRGRTEANLLSSLSKSWRRGIRKSEASGITIVRGSIADLPVFHDLHRQSAKHHQVTPRSLGYFEQMAAAMTAESADRFRLYLAKQQNDVLVAAIVVRVGSRVWSAYGGTAEHARGSGATSAIEWVPLREALHEGADVYDLRGISDTMQPGDPKIGTTRFKIGSNGDIAEYIGEWQLPLVEAEHEAFVSYLERA
jgi:lipid II:glycine glycyltransferase (peptidoglycan interpeptide bridge formation enzyme)